MALNMQSMTASRKSLSSLSTSMGEFEVVREGAEGPEPLIAGYSTTVEFAICIGTDERISPGPGSLLGLRSAAARLAGFAVNAEECIDAEFTLGLVNPIFDRLRIPETLACVNITPLESISSPPSALAKYCSFNFSRTPLLRIFGNSYVPFVFNSFSVLRISAVRPRYLCPVKKVTR